MINVLNFSHWSWRARATVASEIVINYTPQNKTHKAVKKIRMEGAEQMITHIAGKRFWTVNLLLRSSWSAPIDIQSSHFKIPQQSKSSSIVSLFKVMKRFVLSGKKKI